MADNPSFKDKCYKWFDGLLTWVELLQTRVNELQDQIREIREPFLSHGTTVCDAVRHLDEKIRYLVDSDYEALIRQHGEVRWFSEKLGYGFIVAEDGSDIFLHHSAITQPAAWLRRPNWVPSAGDTVSFTPLATGRRTTEAGRVTLHSVMPIHRRRFGTRHRRSPQQRPVSPTAQHGRHQPQPPAFADNAVTSSADHQRQRRQRQRPVSPPARFGRQQQQPPAFADNADSPVTSSADHHRQQRQQHATTLPPSPPRFSSRPSRRQSPPAVTTKRAVTSLPVADAARARLAAIQPLAPPSTLGSEADEPSTAAAFYSPAESCPSLPDDDASSCSASEPETIATSDRLRRHSRVISPPPEAAFYSPAESCPSLPDDDASSCSASEPETIATSDRLHHHSRVISSPPVAGRRDASSGLAGNSIPPAKPSPSKDLHDQNSFIKWMAQNAMALVTPHSPATPPVYHVLDSSLYSY